MKKLTVKQHSDNAVCKVNKVLAVIKKSKAYFTGIIFIYHFQCLFEASNRLQKYHLRAAP